MIRTCTGPEIPEHLQALAALRIEVFRAWPYLYDGDADYEQNYLRRYAETEGAAIILAIENNRLVGASTCIPLRHEMPSVQAPFLARKWPVEQFCYYGESVLLPDFRGRGIGQAFFTAREAHARTLPDCRYACFCSVQRPREHPARPAAAKTNDNLWSRSGFVKHPELSCTMNWKDLGKPGETTKHLTFWLKSLTGAPLP